MTPKRIVVGLLSALVAAMIIASMSCNTTKSRSSVQTFDSTEVVNLKKRLNEIETENTRLRSYIKELESGVVFNEDPPCNDSLLMSIIEAVQNDLYISQSTKDSLQRKLRLLSVAPKNEVNISASGDIQIKGAIKAINLKLKEKTDSIEIMKQRTAQLEEDLSKQSSVKITEEKKEDKKVKPSLFGSLWWVLLVVGFVGGVIVSKKLSTLSIFKNNKTINNGDKS